MTPLSFSSVPFQRWAGRGELVTHRKASGSSSSQAGFRPLCPYLCISFTPITVPLPQDAHSQLLCTKFLLKTTSLNSPNLILTRSLPFHSTMSLSAKRTKLLAKRHTIRMTAGTVGTWGFTSACLGEPHPQVLDVA